MKGTWKENERKRTQKKAKCMETIGKRKEREGHEKKSNEIRKTMKEHAKCVILQI